MTHKPLITGSLVGGNGVFQAHGYADHDSSGAKPPHVPKHAYTRARPKGPYQVQWYRDGVAIPGATQQNYTPTPADAGHKLDCRVTTINKPNRVVSKP